MGRHALILVKEYAGLMRMQGKISVGQKAPDFTLLDTELKPRRLRDFLDNKVKKIEKHRKKVRLRKSLKYLQGCGKAR